MILWLSFFLVLFAPWKKARADPTIFYSFAAQLPPVAVADNDYSYSFLSNTFITSESGGLNYTVSDLPDWLSYDDSSRTLSGSVPSFDDSQSTNYTFDFLITATDSSGSSYDNCTIVVTSLDSPTVNYTMADQLVNSNYTTNGQNGIVLNPGEEFSVTFYDGTFEDHGSGIAGYYAMSGDHSPLPSWIFFNPDKLEFYGSAPAANSEIAPAESFNFILSASAFAGFSQANAEFQILTGQHQLSLVNSSDSKIEVNASAGSDFNYTIDLASMINLDNETVNALNISSINSNATDWITFNSSELNCFLSGKPDNSSSNQTIQVTVADQFGDEVYFTVSVSVLKGTESTWANDLPDFVRAYRGQSFNFTVNTTYLSSQASLEVSFSPGNVSDWLSYDNDTRTFEGVTPNDFYNANLSLTASMDGTESTRNLLVRGQDFTTTTTSTSSSATSSTASRTSSGSASVTPTSSPSAAAVAPISSKSNNSSSNKTIAIACGVAIPIGVLAIVAGILLCCCCRRRRKNDYDSGNEKSPKSVKGSAVEISNPIMPDPLTEEKRSGFENPRRLSAINMFRVDEKGRMESILSHPIPGSRLSGLYRAGLVDDIPTGPNNPGPGAAAGGAAVAGIAGGAALNGIGGDSSNSSYDSSSRSSNGAGYLSRSSSENTVGRYPRRSWRNTSDRYRSNRDSLASNGSLNSLATVATNELFSVRLVNNDQRDTMADIPGSATQSTILTPRQSLVPAVNGSSRNTNLYVHPEEDGDEDNADLESRASFDSMNSLNGKYATAAAATAGAASYQRANPFLDSTNNNDNEQTRESVSIGSFSTISRAAEGATDHAAQSTTANNTRAPISHFSNSSESSSIPLSESSYGEIFVPSEDQESGERVWRQDSRRPTNSDDQTTPAVRQNASNDTGSLNPFLEGYNNGIEAPLSPSDIGVATTTPIIEGSGTWAVQGDQSTPATLNSVSSSEQERKARLRTVEGRGRGQSSLTPGHNRGDSVHLEFL